MDKIKYRLVFNRKNHLLDNGTALIQLEIYLNLRKTYITTRIYIRPDQWDAKLRQIINHPNAIDLNAYLYEQLITLEQHELNMWKRGQQPTLASIREAYTRYQSPSITFATFATQSINNSTKRPGTKANLLHTLSTIQSFRPTFDFSDITYTFLTQFEQYLRGRGNAPNTIAKHLRNLRTLTNEAINQGYISPDSYPFRKYRIHQEKPKHVHLTKSELRRIERITCTSKRTEAVRQAYLFCCYTGLRYSDFVHITDRNITTRNSKRWLTITSIKTNITSDIPISLLFDGAAVSLLDNTPIAQLTHIGSNADANKHLKLIATQAHIDKRLTFHTARHTFATLLIHNGIPITTVQRLLGHTDLSTTQIYSEVMPETIIRDIQRSLKRKK